jgi:RNA polymerase sigma-70 factor (ECF subfamily)
MIAESGLKSQTGYKMTFEEIYRENSDMVLNLAFRMTGREEAARDLTQDVFIKVYRNQGSFHELSKISTWIYRIAMNHILNYLKREKRLSFLDFMEQDTSSTKDNTTALSYWDQNMPAQPDKELEEHEKEIVVRKMLDELPAKYRIPFLLFRYEDLSYQQIAEQLDLSLSAVETRIHRAKKKLAQKLQPWIKHI